MSRDVIIFLRGLNTWDDDDVHVGPIKIGPMHLPLKMALNKFEFIAVPNMRIASIEEMAERALTFLNEHPVWRNKNNRFHIVGHSMGGLIGRVLLHLIQQRADSLEKVNSSYALNSIQSMICIASPHHGSAVAEWACEIDKAQPALYSILKLFGYDISEKKDGIGQLTAQNMSEFNRKFPNIPGIRYADIRTHCSPRDRSFLFWITRNLLPEKADGLVALESQKWGEAIGVFELDHYDSIGYPLSFLNREQKKSEFARLAQTISDHILAKSENRI